MPKPHRISEAEWIVMQEIWRTTPQPRTAAEVAAELMQRTDWSPRTIKTLLSRLVKKGALTFETEGNRYLYRPAVEQSECVRQESRSFVKRVFGGQTMPALVHLVQSESLSDEQIEELRHLLAEKKTS